MDQKKIDRIRELTRLSRERALTEEEQRERKALREEYILAFKQSLVNHLENTYVIDDKGNKKKLRRRGEVQ